LSIKVYPRGKVEVVVPMRTRPATVASFVEENRDWIAKARKSFAQHHSPEDYSLPAEIHFPAISQLFEVRYCPQAGSKSVRYRFTNNTLTLSGNTDNEDVCRKAIRRWLAEIARKEFTPQIDSLSRLTGVSYRRLQIRAQKTCWGSRSSSGTISLNLCLLFLDARLVRYLIIHELCHGRHMNHSKRFWALVGRFEPDFRRLDKALGECWRYIPPWLGIC
jgi:predicted metal-dependent hydrolase